MLLFTGKKDVEAGETRIRKGSGAARVEAWAEAGVRVRPLDDGDLERILELRSVVRWSADPRAFDLLRGVRDARWAVAEGPDGVLVGMVGAVPLGPVGVLCHLAVHDGYRNLGLGAGLSSWAVAYLRSRGATTVRLYSTRRAEGLYRSLGFEATGSRTVYRLEEATGSRGRERAGGGRVETLALADLPELYGTDRWVYGADRSPLVSATLRLHPGGGLVARDSTGRMQGYLVRSAGHDDAVRLGPFAAASPDVAAQLLARALRETGPSPVRVVVPGPGAGPAHALLREFGFVGRRDRLRMELGGGTPERPPGLAHYGTTPYLAT